jgi:hypothetical protein
LRLKNFSKIKLTPSIAHTPNNKNLKKSLITSQKNTEILPFSILQKVLDFSLKKLSN